MQKVCKNQHLTIPLHHLIPTHLGILKAAIDQEPYTLHCCNPAMTYTGNYTMQEISRTTHRHPVPIPEHWHRDILQKPREVMSIL